MRTIKVCIGFVLLMLLLTSIIGCEEEVESGNIAFYRRVEFFDCGPLVVNIYLNDQLVGTVDNDFPINNSDPECGMEKCLTIPAAVGSYTYKAECSCVWDKNDKIIETWTGEVKVKQDSCSKVFIDLLDTN